MFTDDNEEKENDEVNQLENNANDDYEFSYDSNNDFDNDDSNIETEEFNNSNTGKVILIVILLLVLGVLIFLLFKSFNSKSNNDKPVEEKEVLFTIDSKEIELLEGDSKQLMAYLVDSSENINVNWSSDDLTVASVNEVGLVTALKEGKTVINAIYFNDNVSYEANCTVTVIKSEVIVDSTKPTMSMVLSGGQNNVWTSKDVDISIVADDDSGKVFVKYGLDCVDTCNYIDVSDTKKISIKESGTHIIKIVAYDETNNEVVENVTVKIDRDKPTCSLTISADGTVTATKNDSNGLSHYGFAQTGNNEESKKVSDAGTVTYYVTDVAGNSSSCSINVSRTENKNCASPATLDSNGKCSRLAGDAFVSRNGEWKVSSNTVKQGTKDVDNCANAGVTWEVCTVNRTLGDSECYGEGFYSGVKCYLETKKTRVNTYSCSNGYTMIDRKCYEISDPTITYTFSQNS